MTGSVQRITTIALNTYREAVRARVLLALVALAVATSIYSIFIAALSLHQEARVVADIGAWAISVFSVVIAITLGATSLYRELELKTIFPILTRPLERWEYLIGKYTGTLLTLLAFVLMEGGVVLGILSVETGGSFVRPTAVALGFAAVLGLLAWRAKTTFVFGMLPASALFFAAMVYLSGSAGAERQLLLSASALSFSEGAIVAAVALLFSSFSSPFLTAAFTTGVFLVGRSADTLGNLPVGVFGEELRAVGHALSRVFPNLQLYVPPRPLLQGLVPEISTSIYVLGAMSHAALVSVCVLAVAVLLFRRRDFQ